MTDTEKRAHDLAILYMQLEIKSGKIEAATPEEFTTFVGEYRCLYEEMLKRVEQLPI